MYLYLAYVYVFLGIFLEIIYMKYSKSLRYNYILILWFFVFKIVFNYRQCTLSYIECKLRNVKKDEGYINKLIENLVDIRNTIHYDILMIIVIITSVHWIINE